MAWRGSYLLPLAVALSLGIVQGDLFDYFPLTLLLLWVILLCFILPIILRYKHLQNVGSGDSKEALQQGSAQDLPISIFLFILMTGIGLLYFRGYAHWSDMDQRLLQPEEEKVLLTGWVSGPVRHLEDRLVFLLHAERLKRSDREIILRGTVRVSVYDPEVVIRYGDRLQLLTKLKRPRGFLNPGGFDYGGYQERQGVIATGSVRDGLSVTWIGEAGNPILRGIDSMRERIRRATLSSLEGSDVAIFQAMILGEGGGLTQEIRERFMASGVTHILSISGSHLGLVALVAFALFRGFLLLLPHPLLLSISRWLIPSQTAALLTILPVTFYALLAGGEVATLRSLLMILIYLIAILVQRFDHLLNAWAVALLAVLLWNPQTLFDISFQLSYLSVLVIILFVDRKEREQEEDPPQGVKYYLLRLFELGEKSLLLSLVVTVGTAPLVLYYFNQFPWVGIFSNIVIVPLAGAVVVPLGLVSGLLALWMESLHLPFAGLNHFFLSLFYDLVSLFARIPGAEVHLPSLPIGCIGIFYLLFFVAIQGRWGWVRRGWAIGLASLLVILWLGGGLLLKPAGELRVTFLDVGQGDGAVVRFPGGEVMLIDGGGARRDFDVGRAVVAPYLWDEGVTHLNYVVVTHPQADHEGGIPYLLKKFSVGEVWANGQESSHDFHQAFKAAIQTKGIFTDVVTRGKKLFLGDETTIALLNPPEVLLTDAYPSRGRVFNDRSVVVRIQNGRHSFLFTGDIERRGEQGIVASGAPLESTVLKVPHHGSKGSLDPEFLARVCPQIGVISVGARNPYGHPTPEALSAYESLSTRLYRTDRDGAVMVRSDGERLRITRAVDLQWQRVALGKGMLGDELENWKRVFSKPF